MRFLVDNQLPSALARFLSRIGTEAAHVLDLGLAQSGDAEIWSFAVENKFVLISKITTFSTSLIARRLKVSSYGSEWETVGGKHYLRLWNECGRKH